MNASTSSALSRVLAVLEDFDHASPCEGSLAARFAMALYARKLAVGVSRDLQPLLAASDPRDPMVARAFRAMVAFEGKLREMERELRPPSPPPN